MVVGRGDPSVSYGPSNETSDFENRFFVVSLNNVAAAFNHEELIINVPVIFTILCHSPISILPVPAGKNGNQIGRSID
eukprot:CAMPEP_0119134554 /NCGR_PEP_ID=MMETSP1310-20130426/17192_1 /TAXON_ID=464262 /ORGANISM="Genus nov. species nov., Strain RCC2339" /LENGTH=77 /DNA_ID=CAMNT_0007125355 /DNA_START=206 /DNA_END=439 /DNA_ORIENTATION=-